MWQVKCHLRVGVGIELHYTYTYKNRFTQHLYPGCNTTLSLGTLCIRNHIQILSILSKNYSFYPRKIIITCSHPLMTSTERAKITRLTSARSLFGRSTSEKYQGCRIARNSWPRQIRHRCSQWSRITRVESQGHPGLPEAILVAGAVWAGWWSFYPGWSSATRNVFYLKNNLSRVLFYQ